MEILTNIVLCVLVVLTHMFLYTLYNNNIYSVYVHYADPVSDWEQELDNETDEVQDVDPLFVPIAHPAGWMPGDGFGLPDNWDAGYESM